MKGVITGGGRGGSLPFPRIKLFHGLFDLRWHAGSRNVDLMVRFPELQMVCCIEPADCCDVHLSSAAQRHHNLHHGYFVHHDLHVLDLKVRDISERSSDGIVITTATFRDEMPGARRAVKCHYCCASHGVTDDCVTHAVSDHPVWNDVGVCNGEDRNARSRSEVGCFVGHICHFRIGQSEFKLVDVSTNI